MIRGAPTLVEAVLVLTRARYIVPCGFRAPLKN